MRRLRLYDPEFHCEVTIRARDGRFAFDPNDVALRERIYGVIAEAARLYGVAIFVFHFMSNHYHALYGYSSPEQLVLFLAYLHGNLAKLANEVEGLRGPFWCKPKVVAVSVDAESTERRFRYILGQAVRANLCRHPGEFPGASAVDALLYGSKLVGRKLDRSQRCRDAHRLVGGAKPDAAYETHVEVPLAVPPCWADLSQTERRGLYQRMAQEIAESHPLESTVLGTCLRHENTTNLASPPGVAPPQPTDVSGAEPPRGGPSRPPAKLPVPSRKAEDGGTYRHGEAKPKTFDGEAQRRKFPLLLSVHRAHVAAYEARYEVAVEAYSAAKRGWCEKGRRRGGCLRAAKITLPAWMLLGTMSLKVRC